MLDMTMCVSELCPRKETCYRYMAVPEKYQSYSDFYMTCNGAYNGKDYFLAILPEDKVRGQNE